MNKSGYNFKDDQFKDVSKILKDLPKVNAPDNFEYNLKVKIDNNNFGLSTGNEKTFSWWKVFVPASGLVAASVFSFFFFSNSSEKLENPFQLQPILRTEISSNILNATGLGNFLNESYKINDNDVVVETITKPEPTTKKNDLVASEVKSYSLAREKVVLPFDTSNSTDLDAAIGNKNNRRNIDRRASLANAGSPNASFNGFYLGQEVDKKYVEAMKARIDSLKKNYLIKRQQQRAGAIK